LMHNRYLIAQKGKKQYFLIEAVWLGISVNPNRLQLLRYHFL
jgi:hypothetical protein